MELKSKKKGVLPVLLLFLGMSLFNIVIPSCSGKKDNNQQHTAINTPERLQLSSTNPHLLETLSAKPVFLNNYTAWSLIGNGTREDIADFLKICSSHKFNMVSAVLPITTPGYNPEVAGEYDFWDHVDFVIDQAAENGMYISLHPTWGDRVAGAYNGSVTGGQIVFNTVNAYKYGLWLGQRYGERDNLIWMLGGDRSAIYNLKDGVHDYREVWRALAEGLADGIKGEDKQDGQADYDDILMSYHPRKWAPNSSEWFHNDPWLSFNSIQDTPYDQVVSMPGDYKLKPTKPSWLFEGRYEGRISAWGIRYQAYQTVFAGAFGHTYGSDNYAFPSNWRELTTLPGTMQMAYLYKITREIWTDAEFFDRMPDQNLIVGDQGNTYGDGEWDDSGKKKDNPGSSDRITAIRGGNGTWAMVYSANGRDITLDLSLLVNGKLDVYWFNPRTGKWWINDEGKDKITPFKTKLACGNGNHTFDPPGMAGKNNDWVLILK